MTEELNNKTVSRKFFFFSFVCFSEIRYSEIFQEHTFIHITVHEIQVYGKCKPIELLLSYN